MNYYSLVAQTYSTKQSPRLYFFLLLLILLPLSCFIGTQLFRLVSLNINLLLLRRKNISLSTSNELLSIISLMLKKKCWLKSIELIESYSQLSDTSIYQHFNALGFIYYSVSNYKLAKFYYLKAINVKKDYVPALQNLAKLYKCIQDNSSMLQTCGRILFYDPSNKMANFYLSKADS